MRDIKFRAWIKNKMVYAVTVCESDCFTWISYPNDIHKLPKPKLHKDAKLMQYTGLKDKKGKEIYEGDIIKYQDCLLLIQWGESIAGFYERIIKQKNQNIVHDIRLYRSDEEWEVIGNWFQNYKLIPKYVKEEGL